MALASSHPPLLQYTEEGVGRMHLPLCSAQNRVFACVILPHQPSHPDSSMDSGHSGSNSISPKDMSKSQPPTSVNVILFGNVLPTKIYECSNDLRTSWIQGVP